VDDDGGGGGAAVDDDVERGGVGDVAGAVDDESVDGLWAITSREGQRHGDAGGAAGGADVGEGVDEVGGVGLGVVGGLQHQDAVDGAVQVAGLDHQKRRAAAVGDEAGATGVGAGLGRAQVVDDGGAGVADDA